MLIDVSKYFITAGLLGGFLTEELGSDIGIGIFAIAILAAVAGFYIIPAKKEE